MMHSWKKIGVALLLALLPVLAGAVDVAAPPDSPANVVVNPVQGRLSLLYYKGGISGIGVNGGSVSGAIFDGELYLKTNNDAERILRSDEYRVTPDDTYPRYWDGVTTQHVKIELTAPGPDRQIILRGTVATAGEALAAEDTTQSQTRFSMIRTSDGPSRNLRNNAVYCRTWDWELSGPAGATRIAPKAAGAEASSFTWESHGPAIELTFRPLFYQKHKNLRFYQPWNYNVWKDSVSGWCSWWAYKNKFNQQDLDAVVDVMAAQHLRDYGYRYVQIDDTFQTLAKDKTGIMPDMWLKWNAKFPGGPQYAAQKIKQGGFDPGIWIYSYFKDVGATQKFPERFVRDASGKPYKGKWVEYGMDASVPATLDAYVRPVYKGFKADGYNYVKIDGLRHLLYDSYYNQLDYFTKQGKDAAEVFRKYFEAIRDEMGRDTFILACWGVLPETIGLADASRLGGDGFGPATLQQYNSWNGIVWRNDPDHCDVLPRQRAANAGNVTEFTSAEASLKDTILRPTLVSMAGGLLMLSDQADVYKDRKNLEGAKRAAPVLFSVPGQLYDFDPRKTDVLKTSIRTDVKAGSKASPIDADQNGKVCPWWMLEIDRPFEHWNVLTEMNWTGSPLPEEKVSFADLGLDPAKEYLVYEFWTNKFVGALKDGFSAPELEVKGTRTYAIREVQAHPQILSTSRHISQGGVDLSDVKWDAASATLSGKSKVVIQDPYQLVIYAPEGYILSSSKIIKCTQEGPLVKAAYTPEKTGEVEWSIRFAKK